LKNKRPYLALIFDLKKTPRYSRSFGEDVPKKFNGYEKEYSNKRWALYCSCGERNDIDIDSIRRPQYDLELYNSVTCAGCKKIYKDLKGIKLIYSRSPIDNVTSKRFGLVEKDNFYALYSFATVVMVSVTTKKLIFKDIGNYSLYLSKKINAVQIKTSSDKIITVPFRFLVKHCSAVVNHMLLNALSEEIIEHGLFEKQIINPLLKFCNIIESRCDKRDVDRIISLLDKEKDDVYFGSLFKHNCDGSTYTAFYQENCFYDMKSFNDCRENVSLHRYVWIQYLKQRMCIMLAIHMYPPLATIALSYGTDKLLNLLSDSSLMCSLTHLRKKKPTNPKDIIETMFKSRIMSEFYKRKKIEEYIRKENKKRNRKLKSNPEDKKLKEKITFHPTLCADSRIPTSKDLKQKVKNLHFKKSYVYLFLEDFDDAANVLYGFLNGSSFFEDIDTVDKIINNIETKNANNLLISAQSYYSYNSHRLGKFKLNYKYLCHLLKMHNPEIKTENWTSTIQLYSDVISMMTEMEIPISDIFKTKTKKQLNDLHNSLTQSYRLRIDKKMSEELNTHVSKYRHTETIIDDIKFSIIDTPEKFYEESSVMNHCVKTYCHNVAAGYYIIYSVEDLNSKDRSTLSVSITKMVGKELYSFNQLKAKHNGKSTERIINSTIKFIDEFFGIKEHHFNDLTIRELQKASSLEEHILGYGPEPIAPAPAIRFINNEIEFMDDFDDNLPF
jgi:hypothetical protein